MLCRKNKSNLFLIGLFGLSLIALGCSRNESNPSPTAPSVEENLSSGSQSIPSETEPSDPKSIANKAPEYPYVPRKTNVELFEKLTTSAVNDSSQNIIQRIYSRYSNGRYGSNQNGNQEILRLLSQSLNTSFDSEESVINLSQLLHLLSQSNPNVFEYLQSLKDSSSLAQKFLEQSLIFKDKTKELLKTDTYQQLVSFVDKMGPIGISEMMKKLDKPHGSDEKYHSSWTDIGKAVGKLKETKNNFSAEVEELLSEFKMAFSPAVLISWTLEHYKSPDSRSKINFFRSMIASPALNLENATPLFEYLREINANTTLPLSENSQREWSTKIAQKFKNFSTHGTIGYSAIASQLISMEFGSKAMLEIYNTCMNFSDKKFEHIRPVLLEISKKFLDSDAQAFTQNFISNKLYQSRSCLKNTMEWPLSNQFSNLMTIAIYIAQNPQNMDLNEVEMVLSYFAKSLENVLETTGLANVQKQSVFNLANHFFKTYQSPTIQLTFSRVKYLVDPEPKGSTSFLEQIILDPESYSQDMVVPDFADPLKQTPLGFVALQYLSNPIYFSKKSADELAETKQDLLEFHNAYASSLNLPAEFREIIETITDE